MCLVQRPKLALSKGGILMLLIFAVDMVEDWVFECLGKDLDFDRKNNFQSKIIFGIKLSRIKNYLKKDLKKINF